jgi:hypothetical protein
MCAKLGIEITEELHKGAVLVLKLPDALRERLNMRGTVLRVTFDRDYVSARTGTQMMDFESAFFQLLVSKAKDYDFDALVAKLGGVEGEALLTAMLRWQNDQGQRMRQEYAAVLLGADGSREVNPESYQRWLLEPAHEVQHGVAKDRAKFLREAAETELDGRLAEVSNADLHPENRQLIGAAWLPPAKGLTMDTRGHGGATR